MGRMTPPASVALASINARHRLDIDARYKK
jgi:hypothetical protein